MMQGRQQKLEGRSGFTVYGPQDWEPGIGSAESHVSGPVRSIVITPAMQQAEMLRSQAHPVSKDASAWRERIFAGRTVPVAAAPSVPTGLGVTTILRSNKYQAMRQCAEGCGALTAHKSGSCKRCRMKEKNRQAREERRMAELAVHPGRYRTA